MTGQRDYISAICEKKIRSSEPPNDCIDALKRDASVHQAFRDAFESRRKLDGTTGNQTEGRRRKVLWVAPYPKIEHDSFPALSMLNQERIHRNVKRLRSRQDGLEKVGCKACDVSRRHNIESFNADSRVGERDAKIEE